MKTAITAARRQTGQRARGEHRWLGPHRQRIPFDRALLSLRTRASQKVSVTEAIQRLTPLARRDALREDQL